MLRGQAGDEMIAPRGRIDLLRETILAAPASRVTFPNLDINTFRFFKIHTVVDNPLGNAAEYYLYVNGLEVKANFRTQYLRGDGAGVFAARRADPLIMIVSSGQFGFSNIELILDSRTEIRWVNSAVVDRVAATEHWTMGTHRNGIQANVTQIDIVSENQATGLEDNGFDTGSYVRLYGQRP